MTESNAAITESLRAALAAWSPFTQPTRLRRIGLAIAYVIAITSVVAHGVWVFTT